MTEEYLKIIGQSTVFTGVQEEDVREILDGTIYHLKSFTKGDMIAQAGTQCKHARIILAGKVAGEMMDLSGKILKIEDLFPSKMIAPAFLYGKRKAFPVNVIAYEDSCIWQMHRDDFSKLLQKDVRLLDNFLNAISNRAQFLSEKIRFLSFPTLRAKLAFLFIQNSEGKETFKLPMTHQQISELFGVARPSLTREIRLMNNDGLISSDRDQIKIMDLKALKNFLNTD